MVNTEIRLIIFFAAKDGEALYSQQKTRLGADCGSDHELLILSLSLSKSSTDAVFPSGSLDPVGAGPRHDIIYVLMPF